MHQSFRRCSPQITRRPQTIETALCVHEGAPPILWEFGNAQRPQLSTQSIIRLPETRELAQIPAMQLLQRERTRAIRTVTATRGELKRQHRPTLRHACAPLRYR